MKELAPIKNSQIMTLEEEILNIDESKIPELISDRVKKIESINEAYLKAKKKADDAKQKVNEVIDNANKLIEKAEGTGNHRAHSRKLFGVFNWRASSADEIEAIKQNIKELVQLEEYSAEESREIASILGTFTESQIALLEVQRAQGEYQAYIADVSKFLFGLCAYNQASTQSILQNLVETLKGSSKEKLGVLAEQQLMLAIDQMKSQENIIVQLRKSKEEISRIQDKNKVIEEKLMEAQVHREHQDELIEEGKTKSIEIKQRLEEGEERDKRQDEQLEGQKQKDIEHDRKIIEGEEHDKRQDEQLEGQKQKDIEHDQKLQAVEEHNKRQDDRLDNQDKLNANYESQIHKLEEQIEALTDRNSNLQSALDEFKAEIANKGVDKWTIVAGSIGVVSAILAVIALIV